MKKNVALILGLFLMLGSFTACAKNAQEPQTNTKTEDQGEQNKKDPNEKVELEFFQQKSENIEIYNQIIAKFSEEYPNIKVNQVSVPDGAKVLVTRVSTNDVPDICSIYPTQTIYKDMMREDIFLDLTNTPILDRVDASIVDLIKFEDKSYAVPVTLNAYGVYYNEDIFKANNIEVPTTYDALIDACEKLKAAGITAFALPDKDTGAVGQQFERLYSGSITKDVVEITEKVAASELSYKTEPTMRQMAELILKLREYSQKDTMGTGNEQAITEFANGNTAMYMSGTWALSAIKAANSSINVNTFAFPNLNSTQPATCGTVDTALAISANSKNVEAAKLFIEFFLRPEIAQMYCDADRNPNIVKEIKYSVPQLDPINKLINEGNFTLIPSSFWPAGYRDEIQVITQELIMEKDVEKFLSKCDEITISKYKE